MPATSDQYTVSSSEHSRPFRILNKGWLVISLGVGLALGCCADHLFMRWQMNRMHAADAAYFTEQLRMQAVETKRNQEALGIVGVGGLEGLKVQGVSFQTEAVSAYVFDLKLGDEHVAEVAKIPSIKQLRLGSPTLTTQCLQHLDQLSNLESLQLSGAWVKDGAAEMMSDKSSLKKLELQETSLSDEHMRALVKHFPQLQELSLYGNTGAGTQTIAAVAGLKDLRKFVITSTALKDDEYGRLPAITSLQRLEILSCSLSDAALAHIGKTASLIELDLSSNPITDEGLKQLTGLKKLQRLRVVDTSVTSSNVLAAELPDCKIEFYTNMPISMEVPAAERVSQ